MRAALLNTLVLDRLRTGRASRRFGRRLDRRVVDVAQKS
jgi:hypothetical protein